MPVFLRVLLPAFLCAFAAYADLLIRNVTIVDVETGSEIRNQSVLIHGDRITAIAANITGSKDVETIDGAGKFVVAGLWDMQVHLSSDEQLGDFVFHGITGVRDRGANLAQVQRWRDLIHAGKILGPHIETCGSPLDGFPSEEPGMPVVVVRSAGEARAAFDRLDNEHADFIGILPRLPRDAYFALAERARKWYSTLAGPVPESVGASEAVDARQKSIEGLHAIALACSAEEKKLREASRLALERHDWESFAALESAALETFSPEKASTLFQRMSLFGTAIMPSLARLRSSECCGRNYGKLAALLPRMQKAGVTILAGGGSAAELSRELQLMAACGLTPAAALRSATIDAARFVDSDQSLGSIEPAKIADFVLLNADPLADVRNISGIAAVVVAGKYIPPPRMRK